MFTLKLMTLTAPFEIARIHQTRDMAHAMTLVQEYTHAAGFRNVKVTLEDDYTYRYTATTPNGRAGRNVAYLDASGYDDDTLMID